jgi:hypothetical protein
VNKGEKKGRKLSLRPFGAASTYLLPGL